QGRASEIALRHLCPSGRCRAGQGRRRLRAVQEDQMTTTKTPVYVGLDVGGTTMKAGVVDDNGTPLSAVSLPTEAHKGQEAGLARMCETIRHAVVEARLQMKDIAAIGVATPGLMDIPAGVILDPPNLKPWRNVPVREHIHKYFQLPTAF